MTDPVLPPGNSPTGASHPSGQASPAAPTEPTAAAIKRRQALLLAGIAGTIVGGTLLSVSLTGTKGNDAQPAKPQSTNILAPGAQVDPRDAWRGQADAQLKAIEQRSRDLAQRNAELEGRRTRARYRQKRPDGKHDHDGQDHRKERIDAPRDVIDAALGLCNGNHTQKR